MIVAEYREVVDVYERKERPFALLNWDIYIITSLSTSNSWAYLL